MFQYPWLITIIIAATRMYRGLQDFSSPVLYDNYLFLSPLCSILAQSSSHVRNHYESAQRRGPTVAIKGTEGTSSTDPISLRRINVGVHTSHEESLTTQTSLDGSVRNTGKQVDDELDDPRELV